MNKELMALKCVKCGAPLLGAKEEFEYIACLYCGFTQKVIDSQQYIEKLRGEIFKWISEMVPPTILTTETVDVVARHNLFIHNVKPRISPDYMLCRSRLSMLLSNPLLYLPFWSTSGMRLEENTKDAFERLAKIEGLSPLAVVDEDRNYHSEIVSVSGLYAYLVNVLALVKEKAEADFIINNLEAIDKYLEGRDKKAEYMRVISTLKAYEAVKALVRGDSRGAKMKADESLELMRRARDEAKAPQVAFMIPGIDKDIKNIGTIKNLSETSLMYTESGREQNEFLMKMGKFFKLAEEMREKGKLGTEIYSEITGIIRDIVASKTGFGQIRIFPGEGNILVPMWVVPITYTFATGVLFMKKGKAVEDVILVSAVPASQSITDIFLLKSTVGFFDRIKGMEETLSKGILTNIATQTRLSSVSWSTMIIPPLITRDWAERSSDAYIQEAFKILGKKMKFGTGEAKELIFLPATVRGNDIDIPVLRDAPIRIYPYLNSLLEVVL